MGLVVTTKRPNLVSPLPGVTWLRWALFARALRVQPHGAKTDNGLGAFNLTPPALAAVGLLAAKRVAGKWQLAWKPGLSEAAFLGSKRLQYAALAQLCKANVRHVQPLG